MNLFALIMLWISKHTQNSSSCITNENVDTIYLCSYLGNAVNG